MYLSKQKLQIAMARRGFDSKSLAEASGISRATMSYIYNGKSCTPETAGKIADALKVDVEYLVRQEAG